MKKRIPFFLTMLISVVFLSNCSDEPTAPHLPTLEIYASASDFKGESITFTAIYGEGVADSSVEWIHKGIETYRYSRQNHPLLIYGDTVKISWNNIKGGYTTTNNRDTVRVRFKHNGLESNSIVISLTNHAPFLDSVKMGSLLLGSNHNGDTINLIRMSLNPSVQETLKVFMRDEDHLDNLRLKFSLDNMVPYLSTAVGEFDSIWVFKAPSAESLFTGRLRLSDGKGGNTYYPFEILVYNEVHTVWVASTNGSVSVLNKLHRDGRKLFSIPRFQQVKFVEVVPPDLAFGTEAVWVMDRTKRSKSTLQYFCDTLFVLDDDGKQRAKWPLTGSSITAFSLSKIANTAFAANGDTVRKITLSSGPVIDLMLGSSTKIEVLEADPVNDNTYWIGVKSTLTNRRMLLKARNGVIIDTLRSRGAVFDSIGSFTSIAASPRNGLLWIGCDTMVVLARLNRVGADTVMARIRGFVTPRIVADQMPNSPFAWVSDQLNSRIIKINAMPTTTTYLSGLHFVNTSSACLIAPGGAGIGQARSLALDYVTDETVDHKTLWVADWANNRVVALNGTTGAALTLNIIAGEAELEQPEAISVNTGSF